MRYNLRHLRAFLALAETGSLTRTADRLRVSQPAVTQGLSKLEARVGVALISRTPHGLFLNSAGETFRLRIERALTLLDAALGEIAPRLRLTATAAQLEALIAVNDTGNFTLAAGHLGLAQPTVHRAIAQLEQEAGRVLSERTAHGTVPTRLGQGLAQAARLALSELSQAEAELAELGAPMASRIVVGAMPLSRSHILPAAIVKLQEERPRQTVLVTDGPYGELLSGLRRGHIDVLIGALRQPAPIDDIQQTVLFHDTAVMVARPEHPAFMRSPPALADLARHPWIAGPPGTPIRDHFDRLFQDQGIETAPLVETGSSILMREILSQTDYLGFASGGQVRAEVDRGHLRIVDIDLSATHRPIGLTTRVGWLPTPAQRRFIEIIRSLLVSDQPG